MHQQWVKTEDKPLSFDNMGAWFGVSKEVEMNERRRPINIGQSVFTSSDPSVAQPPLYSRWEACGFASLPRGRFAFIVSLHEGQFIGNEEKEAWDKSGVEARSNEQD